MMKTLSIATVVCAVAAHAADYRVSPGGESLPEALAWVEQQAPGMKEDARRF